MYVLELTLRVFCATAVLIQSGPLTRCVFCVPPCEQIPRLRVAVERLRLTLGVALPIERGPIQENDDEDGDGAGDGADASHQVVVCNSTIAMMEEVDAFIRMYQSTIVQFERQRSAYEQMSKKWGDWSDQSQFLQVEEWANPDVIMQSITEIEGRIQAIAPRFKLSPPPATLNSATRFTRAQILIGFKFTRLDELVSVMRKRIVQLEDATPDVRCRPLFALCGMLITAGLFFCCFLCTLFPPM